MSGTHKDKTQATLKRYYKERWDKEYYEATNESPFRWLKRAGVLTKKRKEVDVEDHWLSTPSWWTRLMMTKPQRRAAKLWECTAAKTKIESQVSPQGFFTENTEHMLESLDKPPHGRKPHIYFW